MATEEDTWEAQYEADQLKKHGPELTKEELAELAARRAPLEFDATLALYQENALFVLTLETTWLAALHQSTDEPRISRVGLDTYIEAKVAYAAAIANLNFWWFIRPLTFLQHLGGQARYFAEINRALVEVQVAEAVVGALTVALVLRGDGMAMVKNFAPDDVAYWHGELQSRLRKAKHTAAAAAKALEEFHQANRVRNDWDRHPHGKASRYGDWLQMMRATEMEVGRAEREPEPAKAEV